jgi:voltage-gated potassium channel
MFDLVLLASIILSIVLVMLESISSVRTIFSVELLYLEWMLTILFTIEYAMRVFSSPKPRNYTLSFLGIIDFIALLPTYLSIFVSGTHFFVVVRAIRLLRVFRILKLTRYLKEASIIGGALIASQKKILVFLMGVVSLVTIMGTIMYMIEGAEHGFTSIPVSIYWAIVTVTTVGYGDISPQTPMGQFVASILMLMGYAIIAVPTGIVTAELSNANAREQIKNMKICPTCMDKMHMANAIHCKTCGGTLIG